MTDYYSRDSIQNFLEARGQSPGIVEELLQQLGTSNPFQESFTKDISDELQKREGITTIHAPPYAKISIKVQGETFEKELIVRGPAIILVNQD